MLVPGDSLMLGSKGTRVAVADAAGRVQFRNVHVGNDYGNEVEILSGVSTGEMVIMNPADAVRDGAVVELRRARE